MKYRQGLVFSYQRFENALISIISIGPLTRFTPILNFPGNFFHKNWVSLELLNVVLKIVYQIKGTCSAKIDFFFMWRRITTALKEFRVSNNQQYYMWDTRHLLGRVDGHKQKSSSVYKQFSNKHNYTATPTCLPVQPTSLFGERLKEAKCLILGLKRSLVTKSSDLKLTQIHKFAFYQIWLFHRFNRWLYVLDNLLSFSFQYHGSSFA